MTCLKILTVNTHKGFTTFNQRFMLHELRDAVRLISPDIVFLQEVLGEHQRWGEKHQALWPESPQYEFLADSIWQDFAYGRNAVYPEGHHGNALLSKYPITTWDNWDISLSGIEKRGLLHCQIDTGPDKPPLHAICVHLSLREPHRQAQLKQLCEHVNAIPDNEPVIVAGDFNDWRQKSQGILARQAGMQEIFIEAYGKPPRTFPAIFPMLRLDRIYVRSARTHMPLVLSRKPWSSLSDHAPLLAEVEF
ncbi:endonuclease/exonuclease/phosphatase family protein [Gilvimarinus algae]|uniref:Endonuclease/exonuclease/phosphatase family protein n=1 Tax=Gilvimarinus algae TaxID=3058037 RepID=A0ABT8TBT8_9GAMM|nr:endonuclease/exonuclease/phosphatase family protein [Gilvimarinus sp. SDUM040014]MDO3381569.1 endonuclease/exonuclease/phosphatase family protein [Gilvimarinus sp. SDUM040014]